MDPEVLRMTEFQERSLPLLVVATGNSHKTEEIRAMLGTLFEVRDLHSYPAIVAAEETGSTFFENSALKAVGVSRQINGLVLSDDSGLEVDALNGEPGVYSARYSGEGATDATNRTKLLAELAGCSTPRPWSARFRCVMTVARDGLVLGSCEGAVEGAIVAEERGQNGFGYDPLFVPEGYAETFGQLPSATKNELSHRARALKRALALLRDLSPR